MLARVVGEFLRGFVRVFFGFLDAVVEEFHEEALRLLLVVGLHGEEVVNDALGDLLGFLRGFAFGGYFDEVGALGVFDVEVGFRECFGIWFFLRVFPVHGVDDGLEDGAGFHEFHVVGRGARDAAATAEQGHGGSCLPAHGFVGVTRLHEGGRLVLFRQEEGDDGCEDGAADDDAADDFSVCFCDLPELAEVDAFFFL